MMILEKQLILASRSPRRKQLLEQAGFTFTVQPLDLEEDFPADLPAGEVAEFLAVKKARAGKSLIREREILLAADSVVLLDGKIYNKPANEREAQDMLRALSGRMHQVMTGVCLLSAQREVSFAGKSSVQMEALTQEEIEYYVRRYQPYDKAGSYAIQEWIGLCKISRIEGTYANIMGLPVDLVYKALADFE